MIVGQPLRLPRSRSAGSPRRPPALEIIKAIQPTRIGRRLKCIKHSTLNPNANGEATISLGVTEIELTRTHRDYLECLKHSSANRMRTREATDAGRENAEESLNGARSLKVVVVEIGRRCARPTNDVTRRHSVAATELRLPQRKQPWIGLHMPGSTVTEYLAALPADRREALNEVAGGITH
jgi:hypothetical protein